MQNMDQLRWIFAAEPKSVARLVAQLNILHRLAQERHPHNRSSTGQIAAERLVRFSE